MHDVQTYTWSQFVAAVNALLPVDSNRLGPVQPYIQLLIRQAVIELENFIPGYRHNHEILYQASDFVGEGWASRAALPPQARVKDAYLVVYETSHPLPCGVTNSPPPVTGVPCKHHASCRRFPLRDFPWEHRMGLVNAKVALNDAKGCICFDPEAQTFYIYPAVRDCQNVSLFWDGLKVNFQPNEITPFDEQMSLVVANYCKIYISREVDKDLPLSESFQTSYKDGRKLLYLNMKDRGKTNIRNQT